MPNRLMPIPGDRPRGILTTKDREYLAGESNLKSQSERNRRQHIRTRVFNALFDFWLLVDNLPTKDLEQIFDRNKEILDPEVELPPPYKFLHEHYRRGPNSPDRRATTAFEEALTDMIAFAYLGAQQVTGIDPDRVVEAGMTKVLAEYDKTATVTTHEEVLEVFREKLERGNLNPYELEYLFSNNDELLDVLLAEEGDQSEEVNHDPPDWMVERRTNSSDDSADTSEQDPS